MVIRAARESDGEALRRLAARDSAELPAGELLVAEVGGRVLVARSLADGTTIADPFVPTADLRALLRTRAEQLHGSRARNRGLRVIARTLAPARLPLRHRAAA